MTQHFRNPKLRYHEIQRNTLLARLAKLLAQLESPELTREKLDQIKAQVSECQAKLKELKLAP